MKRSELESMTKRALLMMARERGLRRYWGLRKAELVDALLAAVAGDEESAEGSRSELEGAVSEGAAPGVAAVAAPVVGVSGAGLAVADPGAGAATPAGVGVAGGAGVDSSSAERLYPDVDPAGRRAQKFRRREARPAAPADLPGDGELPESYGFNRVFLTARQPDLLYFYWEITDELAASLALEGDGVSLGIQLVVLDESGGEHLVHRLRFGPRSGEYYLPLSMPDARLRAYLGVFRGEEFVELARTGVVPVPRLRPGTEPVRFVTIPLERPMAELIELVSSDSPVEGELSERMAALQERGESLPFPAPRPAEVWPASAGGEPLVAPPVSLDEGVSSPPGWRR